MSSDVPLPAIVDRILSSTREQLETALRAHADEAATRAAAHVRAEADAEIARLRDVSSQEAEDARRAAVAQMAQLTEVSTRQVEESRRNADTQMAQLRETTTRQLEEARKAADAELAELRSALDEMRRTTEERLEEAQRSLERRVDAERTRADADIEDARRMAQSQVEDVQRASDARIQELSRQLADMREEASRTALLLDAVRTLDESPSLTAVLHWLTQYAAGAADRAALMLVKRDTLYAWRLIGFDLNGQTTERMDISIHDVGLLGSAVRGSRMVTRVGSDDEATAPPPFAAAERSRAAAAFPVVIGGDVVAVLYADAPSTGEQTTPDWCYRMETLTRCASRALQARTVEVAMGLRQLLVQPSHGGPGRQLTEGVE